MSTTWTNTSRSLLSVPLHQLHQLPDPSQHLLSYGRNILTLSVPDYLPALWQGDSEDADINPFTLEERDRIIAAFKADRYYKYYAPLIEFLFLTGC
ncbi:MAG: hypothetical protein SFW36_05695 [Leptolyngbyaceae cyanobacterium bins.59]|nr:hypothetical protein [Leptolyngbyaceae cyanobacterium bins.59]